MSGGAPMGDKAALTDAEKEASRWLVRLESQDVSLDDHKRFRAWLSASAEHRTAFEAISATWDRLDNLKHLAREPPPTKLARRALIFAGVGVAAAAAAMVLVPVLGSLGATSYATGVGERETLTFADGSTAELNAGTRIRVRYSADGREVFLDEGEALFEVEADASRPFLVRTEFGAVRVLGTSFVVKLGADNMRATVLRGTVEGQVTRASPSALLSPSAVATPVVATANQEISFRQNRLARTDLAPQAAARRTAWRAGMLAFDGETLREAAAEVGRQTGVRFEFADPALEQVRVGGYISASDPDAFVRLLHENLDISAERRPNDVVILRTAD